MSRQRNRGFTLLELVLSLSIVALLSAALYSAMYAGFRARASGMRQMTGISAAMVAMDLLEQDLQSVLPPTGTLAGPFVGLGMGSVGREADSLDLYTLGRDFNTTEATAPLSEGFRRVQFGLKTDGQSQLLVRRVTRNLLAQTVPEAEEEVLAKNVVALSIGYYDGTTWYQEWDSTLQEDAMPIAVQLTLRVADPSPQDADRTYAITRLIALPCGGAAATATTTGANPS